MFRRQGVGQPEIALAAAVGNFHPLMLYEHARGCQQVDLHGRFTVNSLVTSRVEQVGAHPKLVTRGIHWFINVYKHCGRLKPELLVES